MQSEAKIPGTIELRKDIYLSNVLFTMLLFIAIDNRFRTKFS